MPLALAAGRMQGVAGVGFGSGCVLCVVCVWLLPGCCLRMLSWSASGASHRCVGWLGYLVWVLPYLHLAVLRFWDARLRGASSTMTVHASLHQAVAGMIMY